MPFFLEIPDTYANVKSTRVHADAVLAPDDIQRRYREYCWILEGTIIEEKVGDLFLKSIAIREPKLVQAFSYSPVSLSGYFEVTGPVRTISIKEYVFLYDESRRQRRLPPFQWHESVYTCIRHLDEDDARRKR